jgi:nucleoside 2-deoxyribosyltransferase
MDFSIPRIYTAGAITWANEQYEGWRDQLDTQIEYVEFLHPTETINEYEGHRRAGCVTEDIRMVEDSSGVVAFLTKPEQIGTVTEIVHAVSSGIPVLLLIAPPQWDYDKTQDLPYRIDTPLRYHSSEYWFVVNYLLGDKQVELPDGSVIPGWGGFEGSEAWVSTRHTITDLVETWVEDELLTSE